MPDYGVGIVKVFYYFIRNTLLLESQPCLIVLVSNDLRLMLYLRTFSYHRHYRAEPQLCFNIRYP